MDSAAANEFLELVRQLQGSRAYRTLEGIRSGPRVADSGDGGLPSEQVVMECEDVDIDINNEEEIQWLQSFVTALSVDDLHKAQKFLMRFNDMNSSEQSDLLKMIQTKISQNLQIKTTENSNISDPDIFVVENLIEIANKTFLAKNFEKAQDLLVKAEAIKQTPKAQKLLEQVKRELQKQQNEISQKLIQCAMTAIHDDDYDIAEILLKATWIQYKNEPADKMIEAFFENQDSRRTRNIGCKTKEQLKGVSEKYVKIAESLISEGQIKAAEFILIIAGNIDNSSNAEKLLSEIHMTLYPNTAACLTEEWQIYDYGWCGNDKKIIYVYNPIESLKSYKCYFFLRMAFRAFYYADNVQLAEDFLMEAGKFNPSKSDLDIKSYLEEIENAKNEAI